MPCKVHEKSKRARPGRSSLAPAKALGRMRKTDLRTDAQRCPGPQQRSGGGGEHRQRHRQPGVVPLPAPEVRHHQADPDPRAPDGRQDAEVVPRAGEQRRIEGVEHRRLAGGHGEPAPSPRLPARATTTPHAKPQAVHRPAEGYGADGVAEAHRDQRRKDIRQGAAVGRDRDVVALRELTHRCSGLRTSICHAPSGMASASAANAAQKWASTSLLLPCTGRPRLATVGLRELLPIDDLDVRPRPLVSDAAILVTRHQMFACVVEPGSYFCDEARHHHAVHICVHDEKSVHDVGARHTENDRASWRGRRCRRNEEYCCEMKRTITEPSG